MTSLKKSKSFHNPYLYMKLLNQMQLQEYTEGFLDPPLLPDFYTEIAPVAFYDVVARIQREREAEKQQRALATAQGLQPPRSSLPFVKSSHVSQELEVKDQYRRREKSPARQESQRSYDRQDRRRYEYRDDQRGNLNFFWKNECWDRSYPSSSGSFERRKDDRHYRRNQWKFRTETARIEDKFKMNKPCR